MSNPTPSPRTVAAAALFIAVALTACAVGPNYRRPQTPLATQFHAAEATAYSSEAAQTHFWKVSTMGPWTSWWTMP